jgi:hypothetical protein
MTLKQPTSSASQETTTYSVSLLNKGVFLLKPPCPS